MKKTTIMILAACVIAAYLSLPAITWACVVLDSPESEICINLARFRIPSPIEDDIWDYEDENWSTDEGW